MEYVAATLVDNPEIAVRAHLEVVVAHLPIAVLALARPPSLAAADGLLLALVAPHRLLASQLRPVLAKLVIRGLDVASGRGLRPVLGRVRERVAPGDLARVVERLLSLRSRNRVPLELACK